MTKEEALKLALEALENGMKFVWTDPEREAGFVAIDAIKEALAQPTSGDYALGYAEGFNDACKRQPERTGWPAGLLQDDDRKLSKWLASKPDAKHVVDMAQPEQDSRRLQIAMRQWEDWKTYALELQKKLVKYEGGSPMILNTQPQEKNT